MSQQQNDATSTEQPRPAWNPGVYEDDPVTVCPEHLRFVPCRRCTPGQEKHSTDPTDVERTRQYQQGADDSNRP